MMSNTKILTANLLLSQIVYADTSDQRSHLLNVSIEDSENGPCVVISTEKWIVNFEDLDALVTTLVNFKEAYSTI